MPASRRDVLGVSRVTAYLKQLIETDDLLGNCWIEGEVTQFSRAASGHIYFSLAEGNSLLSCVMWRSSAQRQRLQFNLGDSVTAHGSFAVYAPRGQYQLVADSVQPAGLGLAALEFERLRARLEAEGLFDPGRKRQMPPFPKRIGVVTSPSGAVWHDIQQVLARRYPLVELLLAPAQVQGDGAPESIVEALSALYALGECDVIIVGRGGGSADDLAAFNDERVARAIFAAPVPTISAVGHETDWSLADLVADLRAPTPSAAAEMASPSVRDLFEDVQNFRERIELNVSRTLELREHQVTSATRRIAQHSPTLHIERIARDIDRHRDSMQRSAHLAISRHRDAAGALRERSRWSWSTELGRIERRLLVRSAEVASLDPASVLSRGFALVEDTGSGQVLRSVHQTAIGRSAKISMADGYLTGEIRELVAQTESQQQ